MSVDEVRLGLETSSRCWVCGSARHRPFTTRTSDHELTPEDLRISDSRYGLTLPLVRCGDCGFVFSVDDRASRVLGLYQKLSDPDYEQTQQPRARQMASLLVSALELRPHARSLLDVGAGTGLMVLEAERAGLRGVGLEPSGSLVAYGRREHGIDLRRGTLPDPALDGERFDLVALIDVVEHVPDPVGLLAAAAAQLGEGGMVMVVTPDVRSVPARLLRGRWWHYRRAHIGYFDRYSLRLAAARAGLTPVAQSRPRWYLPVGYLVERVGSYVPAVRKVLERVAGDHRLGPLLERSVPLNLHDSIVLFLEACPAGRADVVAG